MNLSFTNTVRLVSRSVPAPGVSLAKAAVICSKLSMHRRPSFLARRVALVMSLGLLLAGSAQAQLFQNLRSLAVSVPVGSGEIDPITSQRVDGPRWVCAKMN